MCLRKATESSAEPHRVKITMTLFKTEISADIFPPIERWCPALCLTRADEGLTLILLSLQDRSACQAQSEGNFQISAIFPIKIAGARHQRAGYSFKIAFILKITSQSGKTIQNHFDIKLLSYLHLQYCWGSRHCHFKKHLIGQKCKLDKSVIFSRREILYT